MKNPGKLGVSGRIFHEEPTIAWDQSFVGGISKCSAHEAKTGASVEHLVFLMQKVKCWKTDFIETNELERNLFIAAVRDMSSNTAGGEALKEMMIGKGGVFPTRLGQADIVNATVEVAKGVSKTPWHIPARIIVVNI
ncbi:hypothetical protein INR49_016079 [Caranx melampygus]|nr:hypothetical protein INR49_016079 [Caranx melampygus]